jgi:uncharacterized protein YecT (DUF1311 family)
VIWLLPLLAEAAEPQLDCDNPQYPQEMNICAAREFEAADALLNAQWKLTSEVMKQRDTEWDSSWDERPGYFDQLLAAQRAWIAFRDAHCASEGYEFRGGSMEPFMIGTCMTKLTEERTAQLKDLIAVD